MKSFCLPPWRLVAALVVAGLGACSDSGPSATDPTAPDRSAHWVATWHSGVIDTGRSTVDTTYRLLVHNAVGGQTVRLRFSNRYGTGTLRLRKVSIALSAASLKLPPVDPATLTAVSFGGQTEALIPAGEELRSDPVTFTLPADSDVAVTFHVPEAVGNISGKGLSLTTSWTNGTHGGDATDDAAGRSLVAYEYGWPFLTGLEVDAPGASTVVALGDSITDGAFETPNSDQRWPDVLNDRIAASDLAGRFSVVNAGISGNMVTADRDGNAAQGQAAVTRMAWDVFDLPNLSHLIVYEGINDIGVGVPATGIIEGLRRIIAEAHRRGVKVIVSTLTPCYGNPSDNFAYTLNESQRQPFNDWVLTSGEPDGVIDFNAAVSTGLSPETWQPSLTADLLHPNPLGLMVMANAIPLDVLR